MKKFKIIVLFALPLMFASCAKLNEKLRGELEQGDKLDATTLLLSAYESLNDPYQDGNYWMMSEYSTDEALIPTRGGDWDDGGMHRALQLHTWNADNPYEDNAYNQLGTVIFRASDVLENNPTTQQAAEARFIRALAVFDMIDLWGVAPMRQDLQDFRSDPTVMDASDGLNFVISELNAIIGDLPSSGPAYVANQNAARVLLMKVYLNRGAFINRQAPTFDPDDMNQVIQLADQIQGYTISSGAKYYDNFAPENDKLSTEDIFTLYNQEGVRGGNMRGTYIDWAHYNMTPSGNNGECTIGTFYDKFDAGDVRRGIFYDYPEFDQTGRKNPGHDAVTVGFFFGQQYDFFTGVPLMARNPANQPLFFTHDITIRTSGNTLETAGIRVMKYAFDYAAQSQSNNDWVIFRYADVLLMKAEAMLRGGTGTQAGALNIINQIREARGASVLASIDMDELLDERGREMYWEGVRRQDLIRFGKFLDPWVTKNYTDDPMYLVYAIPSQQLAVNFNLKQNPGY